MGDQRGGERDWDVFLWTIGSSEPPENLTEDWGTRDEDPKFSPDGTIVCKSNYDLIEMDTSGSVIAALTSDGSTIEQSMPFVTVDGSQVIYAQGAGKTSDIHVVGRDGTGDTVVQGDEDVQEYYPIVRDAETYLFTRWVSASNVHDQIYLGHWDGTTAQALPLNDEFSNDSDAFPHGDDAVFLSSTRKGGAGGYDLYVADIDSETVVSLNEWNPDINTALDELGVAFSR
jgi:Tol biopolymer transport system component